MKNISVKGIVLGVIAVVLVDMVGAILGMLLFASDMSEESLNALSQDQGLLLWSLFMGTFSTILGGFVAAKIGKLAPYKNAVVIGILGIIIGILVRDAGPPDWFDMVGFVSVVPAALLGGYFAASKKAEMFPESGVPGDLESAIEGLLGADASDAFLIVTVKSTEDFVQFTAVPGTVRLDYPQVTPRQRELRSRFEEACRALGLEKTVNSGSDGSEFIDYDIPGSAASIAAVVRQVLSGVFGVSSDAELLFVANGFEIGGA